MNIEVLDHQLIMPTKTISNRKKKLPKRMSSFVFIHQLAE
jgi:hypothetical protein